jgi:predicted dehydrogenase
MKILRVVLAGCGGISSAWLAAVKDRADIAIVGLVDINRESAEKHAGKFGLTGAVIGADLKSVLAETKPDAVFDCTIPEAHMTVITTALRHGCHVLGEKPMADSMENARAMAAAAQSAGKTYAVMQNRRYLPPMAALRRFLDSGAIGRVTSVYCDYFMAPHFGGFRDQMQHPLLLDMAIHTFDQARFLTKQDPLTVLAHEWNPPGSWYAGDAAAIAIFEMTNHVVYCYRGNWVAAGLSTSWESAWRIVGDKGAVTWDGGKTFQAQVVAEKSGFFFKTQDVQVPYDPAALSLAGHAGCIDEFIRCVLTGGTPQTVCTDNIKSLAMVHGAIAGAAQGRRITCDL